MYIYKNFRRIFLFFNKQQKAVLTFCCLLLLYNISHAQKIQKLSGALSILKPIDIFPKNADQNYSLNDRNKSNKPNVFTASIGKNKQPFFSIENTLLGKSHYDFQSSWKTSGAIKKGDILLARFAVRSVYAKQESGEAVVYFFVQQNSPPHSKSVIIDLSIGPEWKNMDIAFEAAEDMNEGEAAVCFSYAALVQKVEISNLQLLNFEKKTNLAAMPATKFTYKGREKNAVWRKNALKNIENNRTSTFNIQVNDAETGEPVKGATVNVKMLQSDFVWGTAADEAHLASDTLPDAAQYRSVIKELFNTAVVENGYKGGTWQEKLNRRAQTQAAFDWLEKEGFRQRGHNLVWASFKFNAKYLRETAERDTAAFRKLLDAEIRAKIEAIKGRVIAWDVVNELLHEREFLPYLPKNEPENWYRLAKKLDPKAQLFMNEYGMLNSIASPKNIKIYLDTIQRLRQSNTPIDAIGIQGHEGRQPRNPEQVIQDLELFNATGLPVQITEFDVNMIDETLQADYTRDFLIACYSQPIVTGFTIWGFWECNHWKKDAAMFRSDWSAKPNAAVWREWVVGKWKTNTTLLTSKKGNASTKAHLGDYEITVTKNDKTLIVKEKLGKNATFLNVKI